MDWKKRKEVEKKKTIWGVSWFLSISVDWTKVAGDKGISIDIESLQNRLLKVCYVPATSASLPRVNFFFSFLAVYILRCLWVYLRQNNRAHALTACIGLETSWGNACSTCMYKPVRCMHWPVMSQSNVCTYCMGSKVSSLSQIYLYSSYFGFEHVPIHRHL